MTIALADARRNIRQSLNLATPFILPSLRVHKYDMHVMLWVARRKLPALVAGAPFLTRHTAMIVPVAPDLKMVFGVAKMARDQGASRIQQEALRVAPLTPGQAFIGSGAKYRYAYTALAVIFDEYKRTSPDLIRTAVRNAAQLANERGATKLILPDFTENLLAQPNWITSGQRRETAEIAAFTTIEAVRACRGMADTVHIWCWNPENAPLYERELKRF